MDEQERVRRARIVATARTWLGTPYHSGARLKGIGVDCLTLLAEVYAEAGVIAAQAVPYYPPDWHLHRGEERYMQGVLLHAREIEGPPLPGDAVLWRFGRCYSHGAIVIAWPRIMHAHIGQYVMLDDALASRWLNERGAQTRERKFFTLFTESDHDDGTPRQAEVAVVANHAI